jgi:hypothetical protein
MPLNAELIPFFCHLLALLEAHHILHVSRIRVKYIAVRNLTLGDFQFFVGANMDYLHGRLVTKLTL